MAQASMMPAMSSRILFIGGGAIGSYLGAFLSRSGHDVTIVDMWPEHVEAIRERGISVSGPHEPFEARPTALHVHEAQRLAANFDIAFVAMKAYDTAWATHMALPRLAADGYLVSSQNCWNDPVVAAIAGRERSVGLVMSKIAVALWEPGRVERGAEKGSGSGHDVFRVGEHAARGGLGQDAHRGRRRACHRQPLGRALVQALRELHGQSRAGHDGAR